MALVCLCACNPSPTPAAASLPQAASVTKPAYPVHIPIIEQPGKAAVEPTAYPAAPTAKISGAQTQPPAKSFPLDILKNLEYNLPDLPGGRARLQNGALIQKNPAGFSGDINLRLTASAAGDLNGNKEEDAAAVLVLNTGGSGSFYTLAAVLSEAGGARHAASASLGDRIVVKSIAISGGVIRLDLIVHGPNDPLCCPSQAAARQFRLKGSTLEEIK